MRNREWSSNMKNQAKNDDSEFDAWEKARLNTWKDADAIMAAVNSETGHEFTKTEKNSIFSAVHEFRTSESLSQADMDAFDSGTMRDARLRGCGAEIDEPGKARAILTRWKMNSPTFSRDRLIAPFPGSMDEIIDAARIYIDTKGRRGEWMRNRNALYASGEMMLEFDEDGEPDEMSFNHYFYWVNENGMKYSIQSQSEQHPALPKHGECAEEYGIHILVEKWTGMEYLEKRIVRDGKYNHEFLTFSARGMKPHFADILREQGFLNENCWCRNENDHRHSGVTVLPVCIMNDEEMNILKMKFISDKVDCHQVANPGAAC